MKSLTRIAGRESCSTLDDDLFLFLLWRSALSAQTPSGPESSKRGSGPIFAAQCAACHAGKMHMGGLDLSSPHHSARRRQRLILGQESSCCQALGIKPMVKSLHRASEGQEIADITEWVKAARRCRGQDGSSSGDAQKKEWTKAQKEFWSSSRSKEYPVPAVKERELG